VLVIASPAIAQTAKYTFNNTERDIVTSWLFEPSGYLDAAKNVACVSARQALTATPTLDVTQWIRDNTLGCGTHVSDWNETAMVWWMRANSGVNITQANRPPEAAAWDVILFQWGYTLDDAIARVSAIQRNANGCAITMYGSDSQTNGTIPCGNQLLSQSSLVTKVREVLAP
jgi:hypothetical protein